MATVDQIKNEILGLVVPEIQLTIPSNRIFFEADNLESPQEEHVFINNVEVDRRFITAIGEKGHRQIKSDRVIFIIYKSKTGSGTQNFNNMVQNLQKLEGNKQPNFTISTIYESGNGLDNGMYYSIVKINVVLHNIKV